MLEARTNRSTCIAVGKMFNPIDIHILRRLRCQAINLTLLSKYLQEEWPLETKRSNYNFLVRMSEKPYQEPVTFNELVNFSYSLLPFSLVFFKSLTNIYNTISKSSAIFLPKKTNALCLYAYAHMIS